MNNNEIVPENQYGVSNYINTDFDSIGEEILYTHIIPGALDLVCDGVKLFVDRIFRRDSTYDYRTGRTTNQSVASNYHNASNRGSNPRVGAPNRIIAVEGWAIESMGKATYVLQEMKNRIRTNHQVSVGEFYELCGECPASTDWCWGWTDVNVFNSTSRIVRHGTYYTIKFPKVQSLVNAI